MALLSIKELREKYPDLDWGQGTATPNPAPEIAPTQTGMVGTPENVQNAFTPEQLQEQFPTAQTPAVKPGQPPQYDINIEKTPAGKVEAPQGITAQQMATMFPGFFGSLTPEEVGQVQRGETPAYRKGKGAPPGQRPPENYQPISPQNRDRFKQHVIQDIGFDPITFNPVDYVQQSMNRVPALFNYVFQGQVAWADRDKLTKQQWDDWSTALKQYRAKKEAEAKQIQERGLRIYNNSMNEFDKTAALQQKILDAARKPPTTRTVYDEQKKAKVLEEWNPQTKKWQKTGQLAGAPPETGTMTGKVKTAWTVVRALMKEYGGEDPGDAPANATDAVQKYNKIQQYIGQAAPDPKLKKVYDKNLKILLDFFGIPETETVAPAEAKTPPAETKSWQKYWKPAK